MGNNRFWQECFWHWLFRHFLTVLNGWLRSCRNSKSFIIELEQKSLLYLIAVFTDRWLALWTGSRVKSRRCLVTVVLKALAVLLKSRTADTGEDRHLYVLQLQSGLTNCLKNVRRETDKAMVKSVFGTIGTVTMSKEGCENKNNI